MVNENNNAAKFREILKERGLSEQQLNTAISRYVSSVFLTNCAAINIYREQLKRQLARDTMSDKVFAKALKIVGLSEEEVQRHIAE